ncbi:E3 ubiquitin-protein ligase RAD18 isoform X2 [Mixophyes fleayi]|uniref:E3 ubiquitin-protein ligase RAD18 isoform X2 n=1 Tax=Mixophyes fleayi TaxID=3061075 RepID=UPI003F4DDDFA
MDPDRALRDLRLQDLDDLLRCGICFDYFNIAMMIPQCSHNYCSLCIRKFLSYKTQCPTCCTTVTEPELRNNRILDELVRTYVTARKHLSQLLLDSAPSSLQNSSPDKLAAKGSQGNSRKKIKQERKSMEMFVVKPKAETSATPSNAFTEKGSGGKLSAPSTSTMKVKQEPGAEEPAAVEGSAPDTASTSIIKVKVECPVCGVGILEHFINQHLDSCLTRDEKKESLRSSMRKPMAKVVYNLLPERELRKRLKDVGLSTQGSKQQMIRRHQEFVQLFNSQCDSLDPRPAEEIAAEIERNEKIRSDLQAKQEPGMTFSKNQSEEQIDTILQQYRKQHNTEFQQLIEQMNHRWKTSKGKKQKEEPVACDSGAGDLKKEDIGDGEEPTLDNDPLDENMEQPPVSPWRVIRSASPVFSLSLQSIASSSSDILRDVEEATALEESNSARVDTVFRNEMRAFPSPHTDCLPRAVH